MYNAQKRDPLPGDFHELVKKDIQLVGGQVSEEYVQNISRDAFKKEVKEKIRISAFEYLKKIQTKHSKIRDIHYPKLETQQYMTSEMFSNEEVNLLHALRARYINVKANFSSRFLNNMLCPLCKTERDDQPHILDCPVLKRKFKSTETLTDKNQYQDIFADLKKQKGITHLYAQLMRIRKSLVGENLEAKSDPSISDGVLEHSDNLPTSIVHCSLREIN